MGRGNICCSPVGGWFLLRTDASTLPLPLSFPFIRSLALAFLSLLLSLAHSLSPSLSRYSLSLCQYTRFILFLSLSTYLSCFWQGDNCYLCEKCGERVTAQRRCAIKQLPQTLIVHLKRFEFDLSTMSRHKLNHRCSFPMELDMSPWTLEVWLGREGGGRGGGGRGRGGGGALDTARAPCLALSLC